MKWKSTWLLVALAGLLFAFIFFFERHTRSSSSSTEPSRLLSIQPDEITSIQIRRTNEVIVRVERTNQTWNLIGPPGPLFYPAQTYAIQKLLQVLGNLSIQTQIPVAELKANNRTEAEFGLDVPQARLVLQYAGGRTELLFGSKTATSDQVYLKLLNSSEIYVIESDLFDSLPRSANDWRDTSLVDLGGVSWNRLEVRSAGRGFAIQWDQTNGSYLLSKPTPARADFPKVVALWQKILSARVDKFVTDTPRELEQYGLEPPEAELAFGFDTNDLVVVQFGRSPTNDLSRVFARRMSQSNIVQVARSVLEALQTSHTELRDRRLLSFLPPAVDTIEVVGAESFTVRRQTNGAWMVTEPQSSPVDGEAMREWLDHLFRLEGTVEKDVVTDFATLYFLAPPARQYLLKASLTNAAGEVTNRVLAQLDIGARQEEKIFARSRRIDENSVYSISVADFDPLPGAAWQLRDRRVWSFTTNQISRVSIRHQGYTRQMSRTGSGEWNSAINPFAVEETMFRLGELRAAAWVARGEENRALYGFTEDGFKLTIELKTNDKPQVLSLEFGGRAPTNYPYALATVDGQSWIFEFPLALSFQVLRDLSNPPLRKSVEQ